MHLNVQHIWWTQYWSWCLNFHSLSSRGGWSWATPLITYVPPSQQRALHVYTVEWSTQVKYSAWSEQIITVTVHNTNSYITTLRTFWWSQCISAFVAPDIIISWRKRERAMYKASCVWVLTYTCVYIYYIYIYVCVCMYIIMMVGMQDKM